MTTQSLGALRPGEWLGNPNEGVGARLELGRRARANGTRRLTRVQLVLCVLAPFAAGYFLSYVFRTINALLTGALSIEMGIGPSELGVLTSVYFLTMAAVQIPLGAWLDRYGPRRVQSACLLFAAAGATVFAVANGLAGLVVGRALIGIGVATSLMAGLKAVVLWFPQDRTAFANGLIVMTGALGAITATVPAEVVIEAIGWRGLFLTLAILSVMVALGIFSIVPEHDRFRVNGDRNNSVKLRTIYADRRFQQLAPLSALCIGTAWSLQGLWVAPWLQDVEGLGRPKIVGHLLIMGVALSAGALALGCVADWLRRRGISREKTFLWLATAFIVAQLALVTRLPLPSIAPLVVIAGVGAATVLSFAMLPEYFPKEMSARANAALNILHLSSAFLLQAATGAVVDLWPTVNGRPPVEAYQAAFGASIALQVLALGWFVWPRKRALPKIYACSNPIGRGGAGIRKHTADAAYANALAIWSEHLASARSSAAFWQRAGLGSAALCTLLLATLPTVFTRPVIPHVVEVGSEPTPLHRAASARNGPACDAMRQQRPSRVFGQDLLERQSNIPPVISAFLAHTISSNAGERLLVVPLPNLPRVAPRASATGSHRFQDQGPRAQS